MFGLLGSIVTGISNMINNKNTNETNMSMNNNALKYNYAQNKTGNRLLINYLNNGGKFSSDIGDYLHKNDLNGMNMDALNPYLQLDANQMQHTANELAREEFLTSKDIAYNGAQIKAEDYRKAGFSPLLSVGGSSSYSPTSTGGASSMAHASPSYPSMIPMQSLNLSSSDLLSSLQSSAQTRLLNAQAGKLEAETATEPSRRDFITSQTKTEKSKRNLMSEQSKTEKSKRDKITSDIGLNTANESLIWEKLNSELINQGLNNAQIDYYNAKIDELRYNLEESKTLGVRTGDAMPLLFNEVTSLLEKIGVNKNSDLFPWLSIATMYLLSGTNVKIGKFKKPKTKTRQTEKIDKDGNVSYTTIKEF